MPDVHKLAAAVALFSLLAGCGAVDVPSQEPGGALPPADDGSGGAPPPADQGSSPGAATPYRFASPVELGLVEDGAEPNVAVGPGGEVYVQARGRLWRSTDGARSFGPVGTASCLHDLPVCPEFETHRGAYESGSVDGSLVVLADGTLAWLSAFGSDRGFVPFQRSADGGESWSRPTELAQDYADRPWIASTPEDGLTAVWVDGPSGVILHRHSSDGVNWSNASRVADGMPGPPLEARGWTFVPISFEEGVRLARSPDRGGTWETVDVASTRGFPRIFSALANDSGGVLYLVWSAFAPDDDAPPGTEGPRVYLARSGDDGATWSESVVVSPAGRAAVFPWVVAGEPGRVAVAWYEAELSLPHEPPDTPVHVERVPNRWFVGVAVSADASSVKPRFVHSLATEEPVHVGAICTEGVRCDLAAGDRTLLDFFEMRVMPDGFPVIAYAADAEARSATVRVNVVKAIDGLRLKG